MQIKAMVTKIDQENNFMVVVTKDRQFKRLPLPLDPPALGSTIDVAVMAENKNHWGRHFRVKRLAAAAALLLAILTGIFSYSGESSAAAYVDLDMKPSLQFVVNSKGKVTDVTSFNEEGKKLIGTMALHGKDFYQALRSTIGQAGKMGWIDSKEENLVMAGFIDTGKESGYHIDKGKLRAAIHDEMSRDHFPGYIVVNEVSRKQWQAAGAGKLSVNRMIMSDTARKNGVVMDSDLLNHHEMMQAVKKSKTSVSRLFPQNSYRVTWPVQNQKPGMGSGWMQRSEVSPGVDMHNGKNQQVMPSQPAMPSFQGNAGNTATDRDNQDNSQALPGSHTKMQKSPWMGMGMQ